MTEPDTLPTIVLAFDSHNRIAVRRLGSQAGLAFTGSDEAMTLDRLRQSFAQHTKVRFLCTAEFSPRMGQARLCAVQVDAVTSDREIRFYSLEQLGQEDIRLSPALSIALGALEKHLVHIPYLHLGENDFIYKFRPEKERNPGIYANDQLSSGLYQPRLCAAIKALARQHERSAAAPVTLNFAAVEYVIPSHFGFCLGVKNAIERAYETLAANPQRRVFMLSELIHNPFVNQDLWRRGLRYLQTDKGVPFTTTGDRATGAADEELIWDTLSSEDIVIIPAFGATDADKTRLVRKGIEVFCSRRDLYARREGLESGPWLWSRRLYRDHSWQSRARGDQGHLFQYPTLRPCGHCAKPR